MKGHFKYFTCLCSIVQPLLTVELGLKRQLRDMLGKNGNNKDRDQYNLNTKKLSDLSVA